ncbi:MAG: glycosyltransferase family 4 protein [Methylobacillus sp.]|jgi:glycosyltransferase involved in cell wall biosynthesis|nr:glycosyltransferase family 4 protein [Methylobacillus sp.]
MKILIINQYAAAALFDKGGRHYDLPRHLAQQGHEVAVVAARWTHLVRDEKMAESAPAIQVVAGVTYHLIDMPRYIHAHDKKRIVNWFLFAWKLRNFDRHLGFKPDVIVYSSPALPGYLGAEKLARRTGAKLIFEVRDIWPLSLMEIGGYSPKHPFVRFLQWVEDRAYRMADAVFSNLPMADRHMVTRGMDAKKFHWIPNGIDVEQAMLAEPLSENIMKLIPVSGFKVAYTGTLGAANALDTLIDAMSFLKNETDIHLMIAGHGKEDTRLRERAQALGLERICFLGSILKRQVFSLLKLMDATYVGTLPSSLYRFGVALNKLFDYGLAGKPIIYGVDSGDYRPVEEWRAGISVPPGDAMALAEAIRKLRDISVCEREEMGKNAIDKTIALHDYKNIAVKMAEALEEVCKIPHHA